MDNIIDIRGLDFSSREHLDELMQKIESGSRFDNINDLSKTLAELLQQDTEFSRSIHDKLLQVDIYPDSFFLDTKSECPICGYPIVKSVDYESSCCVLCNYTANNFMDWDLQRELDSKVLIWSAHFNGKSVCDEKTLRELLTLLDQGYVPDKIKYKQKMQYRFIESFMNETVVNSSMSEFEKFENTMLMIIFNCQVDSIRIYAESILRELQKLNRDNYINVKEVKRKELARMILMG